MYCVEDSYFQQCILTEPNLRLILPSSLLTAAFSIVKDRPDNIRNIEGVFVRPSIKDASSSDHQYVVVSVGNFFKFGIAFSKYVGSPISSAHL